MRPGIAQDNKSPQSQGPAQDRTQTRSMPQCHLAATCPCWHPHGQPVAVAAGSPADPRVENA
eukprot:1666610-Amphidinium_carterae.1